MFSEFRKRRKETKKIKGIPVANDKLKEQFKDQTDDDRRKWIALAIAAGALVLLGVRACRDDEPDNEIKIPQTTIIKSREGYCAFPDMTTNPAETKVLQEFLSMNGYYGGDIDGVYDEDTKEGVVEFQQEAQEEGKYDLVIDGMAEFFTCKAMGEPYFIVEE